jgi:quinoprotein glucose dehydrogenase
MSCENGDGKAGSGWITFSPVIKRTLTMVASGALLLGAVIRAAVAATPAPPRSPRSVWDSVYTESQARRGDTVYRSTCATCHGEALAGIDDAPPLAGKEFLLGWGGSTVGKLFGRIQRTMPEDQSTVLTPQQISDVVAYILSYNRFPAGKVELGLDEATLADITIDTVRTRPDSGGTHDLQRGN